MPVVQVVRSANANPAMVIPTKSPALILQDKEASGELKFLPAKPSLTEATILTPQAKKPIEEPIMFVPLKTSSAEPPTPTYRSKKPVNEPQLIPIRSLLAKSSVSTRKARQSTEFPQFPAVQPSGKTELERSTTKDVRRQEGKADADKKAQAIGELLAEKREIRSQRDALPREKASLETKLQGQTIAMKVVEGREEEKAKKEVLAKNGEVNDLSPENDRPKKALVAISLLGAKARAGKRSSSCPNRSLRKFHRK